MNIQPNCSTSFGSGYMTKKAKENLLMQPEWKMRYVADTLNKAEAENTKYYDFIYNDDGLFYIKNKKTGEAFTINNPSRDFIGLDTLTCDVKNSDGQVSTKEFQLTEKECENLEKKKFGCAGKLLPDMNLDLLKALEIVEAQKTYKSSLSDSLDKYVRE